MTNMAMTADELRRAQARYDRAAGRAAALGHMRNAAVRQALADGWTHQRISEATGLSRGRISQIKAGAA